MSLSGLKNKFVSFVFQPSCCICDDRIARESETGSTTDRHEAPICSDCFDEVTGDLIDRCYFCGAVLSTANPFGDRCRACLDWKSRFKRAISIGSYHGRLKRTVVEIKRDCNDIKAHQLGMILGSLFDKFDFPRNIDCVVPIPSHWRRRLSRNGFQPSDVIAEGFCRVTGITKSNRVLKSIRFAKKQSKLGPGQRTTNVRGAFQVNRRFSGPNIGVLLIDDVMTSGATVNECSRVLKAAGVSSVFVAVTARAIGVS